MIWNTQTIVTDLQRLMPNSTVITEKQPQGEHYCRDIYVEVKDIFDGITIVGFDPEKNLSDVDQPKEDIKLVEIRTYNSDSDGGCPADSHQTIMQLYNIVRSYFAHKGASCVPQLKNFF